MSLRHYIPAICLLAIAIFGGVGNAIASDGRCNSVDATGMEIHHDDGCKDECPGEDSDGECTDGCLHCGCCPATVSVTVPAAALVALQPPPFERPSPPEARAVSSSGVRAPPFKPPQSFCG